MKKTTILTLSLILVFSLSACNKKEAPQNDKIQGGFQVTENNTLLGWLKKGKTVECSVETSMGEIVMYAQNEKVRMEGMPYYSMDSSGEEPKAENGVSLTVGDTMYMWDKEAKKGTKMNMKKMEQLGNEAEEAMGTNEETKTWEDSVAEWEEQKAAYDCKEKQVSSSIFSPPADVEFVDLNEMMQDMLDLSNSMDGQDGGNVDLEALEAMTKKLKGPDGAPINADEIVVPE